MDGAPQIGDEVDADAPVSFPLACAPCNADIGLQDIAFGHSDANIADLEVNIVELRQNLALAEDKLAIAEPIVIAELAREDCQLERTHLEADPKDVIGDVFGAVVDWRKVSDLENVACSAHALALLVQLRFDECCLS